MKRKNLTTTLLTSSLAILLWGAITTTPPQNKPEPSNPISSESEVPGEDGINPLSDDEDIALV